MDWVFRAAIDLFRGQGGRTCRDFLWKFIMAELTLRLVRA
jgi:hypothetical protein